MNRCVPLASGPRLPALVAALALLLGSAVAPAALGQDFGPELRFQLALEADSAAVGDPDALRSDLATVVQYAIGQAGCLPYDATGEDDPGDHLAVRVRLEAGGGHRFVGRFRRGEAATTVFENEGQAGTGPLLGALLSGAVRTAAASRCK
jgi:hypothetical protein